MKKPYETRDVEELQEIAFYWMQKAHNLSLWKKALMQIMEEKGLTVSIYEIIDKINENNLKQEG